MASKLDLKGVGEFPSEKDAMKVLLAEGRKLEAIARKEWRRYLGSYSPKEYVRTGNSEKAIKLKTRPIKVGTDHIAIEVTWENDLAWHDSWLYKKGKTKTNQRGHAVLLISAGWHSKKLERVYKRGARKPYRHTYYEGYGYLTKVINSYNAVRDKRIGLELEVLVDMKRPLK
jgi:hypothetical protein